MLASIALAFVAFDLNALAIVRCGSQTGTGFWISPERMVTAAHVTRQGGCTVGPQLAMVVRSQGELDVAELRTTPSAHWIEVNCHRPRAGRLHGAYGYAYGRRRTVHLSPVAPTGSRPRSINRLRLMDGRVRPGMSGGPVVNSDGEVVAVLSRGGAEIDYSAARDLADTFICEGRD